MPQSTPHADSALCVLHVDTERGWRGGERQVLWLSHGLRDQGIGNIIGARPGEPLAGRAGADGVPVVALTPRFAADPRAVRALRRALQDHGVDLVHAHTAHAVSLAALATLGTGVPFVAARRVDFPLRGNAFTTWKYGRAGAVIAVSEAVAAVVRRAGLTIPVVVVPDGTDVSRQPAPATAATLASLGVAPNAPLVVQVSQLVGHKDPLTFVAAVAAARARHPAVQALLVGDGPLRGAVEQAVRQRGLTGVLHLAGYRKDADALLAAADVVTLSSREEGMGSVLLDAMVFGRAVAATRAGGIPEVVQHEVSGLLSDVGDGGGLGSAIARLIGSPALARAMASALHARGAQFSIAAMSRRTITVYRDVLDRARRGDAQ